MERIRPAPSELFKKVKKAAIPLAITGAVVALGAIADMNISAVQGRHEAENLFLPNASAQELASARSLREYELLNKTLRRGLYELSASLALLGLGSVLLDRAAGANNRQQTETQNGQSSIV